MSSKFTTTAAILFVSLVLGCSSESAPLTSKSTSYEVAEDPAPGVTPDAAETPKPTEAAPATATKVEPRRPEPMNKTSAADAASSDIVQPTPAQLLAVIRELREQEPKGTKEDEVIADFMSIQNKLIQAVDKLLEMKPADEMVMEAASAKIDSLAAVSQLGGKGALDQAFAFAEQLEQHPSKTVSAFGRQMSFVSLLNAYSTDQVTDSQQVVEAYKKLADEQPKEGGLLAFGRDVAGRFIEKGANQEAAEVFRYTAGLVQPTSDARLSAGAGSLIEQARFAELDFSSKYNAVLAGEEGATEEFSKVLGELTSGETVGPTTLQTFIEIARRLEQQRGEAAAKVFDVLEASSGKVSDPQLAALIQESIDHYRLRSAIVGQPFALTGVLPDGTPFDWSQYKGKVVLVDFWATWCVPCLREMPNIRANFEKYQKYGFEVVGVNLDEEIQEFKDFSSLQPLPWPSVLSGDPDAMGFDHPMAAKYGVEAIPFLVLVNREGIAIALHTRGPALGEKLAELFPEAASAPEPPAAADPEKAAVTDQPPAEPESATEALPASAAPETSLPPEPVPSDPTP